MGPGPRDPGPPDAGTRYPPQSLKMGPGTPLKFKRGTPGPLQNLKVGSQGPLQSLKVGPAHLSLMNSLFFRLFIRFFYLFVFLSFLNKIQKNINCE